MGEQELMRDVETLATRLLTLRARMNAGDTRQLFVSEAAEALLTLLDALADGDARERQSRGA